MMIGEGSAKIVNFMTPGAVVLCKGMAMCYTETRALFL